MRIVFLCGSLEPGHDGVGDYVRRLAGMLITQGHNVAAVALNDKSVLASQAGTQDAEGHKLPVLRISGNMPAKQRFSLAQKWIADVNPDWVSLQFVPYSFHPKGLPLGLQYYLNLLNPNGKWHIMFHELWVGPKGVKQRIISWMQQYIIHRCLNKLKPAVINVSIAVNEDRLTKLGFKSTVLGLFGNISKSEKQQRLPYLNNEQAKNILYFGGPPRSGFLEQVLDGLKGFCSKNSHPVNVVLVSGTSNAKDEFVKLLKEQLASFNAEIIDCGYVEADILSNLMNQCSAGIIRSDPKYIGKSGSAIAMLEHGLPIWMPKWDGKVLLDYGFRKELLHADLSDAAHANRNPEYVSLLPSIVQQFLNETI